jgi:tRNA G37 N-methylase TrmD
MDDAPAATIGKMTIPEKWTRSSGKAVASWRDIESEDREKSVRTDITQRLKCICRELPAPEFQALVAKMTTEQLRGERTLHRWIPLI